MPHAVEMLAQMSNEIASEEASNAVAPRPWRPALFAAGLALAAVLGSSVQSLPTWDLRSFGQRLRRNPPLRSNPLHALQVELAAVKASLETAMRNDNVRLARMADRLERVERAGNEPAAKLNRIAQAINRLEKKSAAAAMALGTTSANNAGAAPPQPKITDDILGGLDRAGCAGWPGAGRPPQGWRFRRRPWRLPSKPWPR